MKLKYVYHVIVGIIISASCLLSTANAGLITDNGDYTKVNDLDWLDMSFTDGKSYNDVLSLISDGNALQGWRVASFIEVRDMYRAFGYTTTPDDTSNGHYSSNPGYSDVLTYLGITYGRDNSYGFTVGYVAELGNDYLDESSWQRTVQAGFNGDISKGFWRGNSWGFDQETSDLRAGTYLTRNASPIPEPSTLVIFMLGLLSLRTHQKRK